MKQKHEELMELALRRGFIWPSFEIYGGAGGFYDFGPLGAAMKNKITQKWRELYVIGEGFFEIDSPTVTPEEVFKASGHVEHFLDVMAECQKCGEAFKMVDLVREQTGKDIEGSSKGEINEFIKKHGVKCPDCGGELGDAFEFNAMFRTTIGPGSKRIGYLRPETAQGIFVDFKRLQRHSRGKLPFGVVQIGKGYRNEISPRQGIIRLREFTMAEAEVFFDPHHPHHQNFSEMANDKLRLWLAKDREKGDKKLTETTVGEAVKHKIVQNELLAYYLGLTMRFLHELGIPDEAIRLREQSAGQRAHYSKETWDAEVYTERFGWVEVAGIADRTDYDLSRHAENSKEDLTVLSGEKKVICHVIEPSYGIDRPFYCALEHSYVSDGKRKYLKLKKWLAPTEVGVFPLLNKAGMPEKAMELQKILKKEGLMAEYDDAGSIGRRYARADEIGTPYCVTVDHQTLDDRTVTIRDRDTAMQVRVGETELPKILNALICEEEQFGSFGELVKK